MGIIQRKTIEKTGQFTFFSPDLSPGEKLKAEDVQLSAYSPTPDEVQARKMIVTHLIQGYEMMYMPRPEFNDLSVITRNLIDNLAFNTYQPNNGEGYEGDVFRNWRSTALRPIVRNKVMSICAHASARLLFPKVFAFNKNSEEDRDAAKAMRYLMEYAAYQSKYDQTTLAATLSALVAPASIVYTEYCDVYQNVKKPKGDSWTVEKVLNKDYSGFQDEVVPVDELFIENPNEADIQKQGFLIRRKVLSYTQAAMKYGHMDNWQYVKPGMITLYGDPNNNGFYTKYDASMRSSAVEEITYWNKMLDVKLVLVNGVLLSECDAPNPREDKRYPFTKTGYQPIGDSPFFYYKSLVFLLQEDANTINTLYRLVVDGSYLNIMPPTINESEEEISSDVFVPGLTTTVSPNTKITPLYPGQNQRSAFDTMALVERSLNESSTDPITQGLNAQGSATAYEISQVAKNASTMLSFFLKMIGFYVRDYGVLRKGDILQYLTIPEMDKITADAPLIYKTFVIGNGDNTTKVQFDGSLPDEALSESDYMDRSYSILAEEKRTGMNILKVHPIKVRELDYQFVISPDVLEPRSEDLEKREKLEIFDRAIQLGPTIDQEKNIKENLFGAYSFIGDPEEYLAKKDLSNPMAQIKQSVASPQMSSMPTQSPVVQ